MADLSSSPVAQQFQAKIESRQTLVGIIGLGYVGLPLAQAFTNGGYKVLGFDIDPVKIEKLIKIQTYHSQKIAAFLKRLADTPDGDGSILDHAIVLYGSNMSNSNAHNHYPLPIALVGGWKALKGGQHIVPAEHTPMANVLLTMLDRAGISQEKLAELAGLHRTYVSSVERGKRNISIENIERLAKALETTMASLMPDAPLAD